jgi:signal transduction histidine kinase
MSFRASKIPRASASGVSWLNVPLSMLRGFFKPFSRSFPLALLEVLLTALGLQALAMWLTHTNSPPIPELLAWFAEHSLWVLGVIRLERFHGDLWWRAVRIPIFGAVAGVLFVLLGHELIALLKPSRAFFEFQALTAPDLSTAGLELMTVNTSLRFVFAYALRATWLEGRQFLRWRLTALTLAAGVFASAMITVIPGLVDLIRNPSRAASGTALTDARELALSFQPFGVVNSDEQQLQNVLNYLERDANKMRLIALDGEIETRRRPPPNRIALILSADGKVIASSRRDRFGRGQYVSEPNLEAWNEIRAINSTGRCRAVNVGVEILAGCPVQEDSGGFDTTVLVAAVIRPIDTTAVSFADISAKISHDFTRVLDTLSQGLLPFFLSLGLIGYLAARRLTTPLERLLKGSKALEAGELNVRVPLESQDEVARLSEGFNSMAQKLQFNVSELEREKATVETLLKANRVLTASASHELRTPLAVIRAHLESAEMRGEPLSSDQSKVLQNEVLRLEGLVEDLFALSRAELGQLETKLEGVNVFESVSRSVKALEPMARQGQITLINAVPEHLPNVKADQKRLLQVLMNLLQNALRYTPEGGLVKLEAKLVRRDIWFTIEDTGIGISQEELQHVFEPFYRTDPARTRTTGGSGLGLSLAREFVEGMGGNIRAESVPDQGSRFTLELPVWRGV